MPFKNVRFSFNCLLGIIAFFVVCSYAPIRPNQNNPCKQIRISLDVEKGAPFTNDEDLNEFKAFAKTFFDAIKANDTIFLREHILFPITHSSFSIFDERLENVKNIDAHLLFKKLHKLFPDYYISKINKAKYSILVHKNIEKEYYITLNNDSGGVESNVNWFFVKRDNRFYFKTFTAEAG